LQVAIAVPLIVMSGIQLDRVRSTATPTSDSPRTVVRRAVEGRRRQDRERGFRIRSVRDDLAKANGVAGASLADGLPLAFRGDTVRTALQPDANAAPKFVRFTSRVWTTTI
jgi:hypothetical protein